MRRGSHYRGGKGRGAIHQHVTPPPPPPLEAIVGRLETLSRLLLAVGRNSTHPEEIHDEILQIYQDLTRVGPHLESTYPDVLDRVMSSMRDASAHPSLPSPLRLAIFQLVELRASHWSLPQDTTSYYTQRSNFNPDGNDNHEPGPSSDNLLPSSESNQKSFLQEVVIKNSDSGKIMGVRGRRVRLIETLSDTIISFEKVLPNAKERTLFINGSSDNSIQTAKDLIEETIERNASPVLDAEPKPANGQDGVVSPLSETPEYSYSIQLGQDVIKISGTHLPFVQEAKLALDEHFLRKFPHLFYGGSESSPSSVSVEPSTNPTVILNGKERYKYDRETLIEIENVASHSLPEFMTTNLDPSLSSIVLQNRRSIHPEFIKHDPSINQWVLKQGPIKKGTEFNQKKST